MTISKQADRVIAFGKVAGANSTEVTVRFSRRPGTDDTWTASIGQFSASAQTEHEAVSRLEAVLRAKIEDQARYHEQEAARYRAGLKPE
jgi:hypothetical protein